MSFRYLALAFTLAATALAGTGNPNTRVEVTTWSRAALRLPNSIDPDPALRSARIPSPNGKYEIACNAVAHEHPISASVAEANAPACDLVVPGKRIPIDLQVGPEALWAPDSDAVAITHSRGGALGTYEVLIYRPESNGPTDVTDAVRRDLARRFPACAGSDACTSSQRQALRKDVSWVNVAAIRWEQRSRRLLIMAWVPDSSSYGANLGRYNGYLVDTQSGRILTRYSEPEFKRRFKQYCGDWGL